MLTMHLFTYWVALSRDLLAALMLSGNVTVSRDSKQACNSSTNKASYTCLH